MKNLSFIDVLSLTLVGIGGLNWGLVGLFDFNLVSALFGDMSPLSRIVYILVGASAIVTLASIFRYGRYSESRNTVTA